MKREIFISTAIALISRVLLAQTPKADIPNYGSNSSIIDIEKWKVVAAIPVGKNPKRLWVANTK